MSKLKLKLDDIVVDSFETITNEFKNSTVVGQVYTQEGTCQPEATCAVEGCPTYENCTANNQPDCEDTIWCTGDCPSEGLCYTEPIFVTCT